MLKGKLLPLLFIMSILVFTGCGGGGETIAPVSENNGNTEESTETTGSLSISIEWPASIVSQEITASVIQPVVDHIMVDVKTLDGQYQQSYRFDSPEEGDPQGETVLFTGIPEGTVLIQARSYRDEEETDLLGHRIQRETVVANEITFSEVILGISIRQGPSLYPFTITLSTTDTIYWINYDITPHSIQIYALDGVTPLADSEGLIERMEGWTGPLMGETGTYIYKLEDGTTGYLEVYQGDGYGNFELEVE